MATGTLKVGRRQEVTLYNGGSTYRNDIGGTAKALTESINGYTHIVVTLYVGNISSSSRMAIMLPSITGAQYVPAAQSTTVGIIRYEIGSNGQSFQLLSSSFSSLFIYSVVGVRQA